MNKVDHKGVTQLVELPNVGKAIAKLFALVDIHTPQDLVGKDPCQLYRELCIRTGQRHDPCVLDVFMSAVHFMEKGEALQWWKFTPERKLLDLELLLA